MADKEHIEIFRQGTKCWNEWREQNPNVQPDLSHENFAGWNATGITQCHYHLLLRTLKENLSRSMQWLGTTYTRRFNLEHFQSGHLFLSEA